MPAPEARFKTELRKAFEGLFGSKSLDAFTFATVTGIGQPSGLPDRFFGLSGGHLWIEAKLDTYQLSKIQRWQLGRMARCGVPVAVMTLLHSGLPREQWRLAIDYFTRAGELPEPGGPLHPYDSIKDKDWWARILPSM